MSVKRPNTLEMHCEKLLVLLVAALCVGVLLWQFLFYGIEVKIGDSTVSLSQLHEKLTKVDSSVTAKLDPASVSPLEIPTRKMVANDSDIFRNRLFSDVTPSLPLPPNEPNFGSLLLGKASENEQVFYNPVFAAAQMKEAILSIDALDLSAIDEELQSENTEFFRRFDAPATSDIIWVSPCAEINLAAFRIELERKDLTQTPPIEPIPNQWFDMAPFILDVVFERQQKAGNTWGAVTIVKPVPGQGDWREMIKSGRSGQGIRDTVFSELASYEKQLNVLQPEMLPTKNQSFPPKSFFDQTTEETKLTKAEEEKKLAEKKVNSALALCKQLEEKLKKAGGPLEPPKGSGSGSDDGDAQGKKEKGGGGGFGMGGGGSVKKGAPNGAETETQASKGIRIALTKQLSKKKKELEKLKSEFELKYPDSIQDSKDPNIQEPKLQLAKFEVINVWAHDLETVAGQTYRYRVKVQIYNPFFARENLLVPTQTKLSKDLVISSATSDWGDELNTPSTTSFFFTRGSARDGIGGRRISVALFRNFRGVQNLISEDIKIGDSVGGVHKVNDIDVDFSTEWYLADIFDDAGSEANGGIVAVFQQRTSSGEVLQELRSIGGDSENHMKFKAQLPASTPKKVEAQTPKA